MNMSTFSRPAAGRHSAGFTIIELLIVIAILGVLASIAIPSYQKSQMKARRAEAKASLMEAAAREEQFFLNNKTYTQKFDSTGLNMSNVQAGGNSANTENDFYTVSVVAPTAACPVTLCFSLQAVPQGVQADDTECGTFTLTNTGTKGAGDTDCW